MFVDICSSILTAMSAIVLLQYTLTCYASVGGATRHTVVRLFVCVCVIMPRWAEPRGIL